MCVMYICVVHAREYVCALKVRADYWMTPSTPLLSLPETGSPTEPEACLFI